jgi:hypothetical protein
MYTVDDPVIRRTVRLSEVVQMSTLKFGEQ